VGFNLWLNIPHGFILILGPEINFIIVDEKISQFHLSERIDGPEQVFVLPLKINWIGHSVLQTIYGCSIRDLLYPIYLDKNKVILILLKTLLPYINPNNLINLAG
jgi:hypothetical protein